MARVLILALLAALALAVTACGDDETTATTRSGTTGGIVGGTATCDKASIERAVSESGRAEGTTAALSKGGFRCADGWAVAFADVGPADAAVTETLLFEAEGQFWIPQDRGKVCTEPSDVPQAIYKDACETN